MSVNDCWQAQFSALSGTDALWHLRLILLMRTERGLLPAVECAARHVRHLAVCQGGPAVRCPFRPVRPPGRRPWDLIAIQLGSVRRLELFTPSVDVGLGHQVGLLRRG
jgi:hypothetical protein